MGKQPPSADSTSEHTDEKVRQLLEFVRDLPSEQRGAVLDRECHGDAELKERVLAMIAEGADDRSLGALSSDGSAADTVDLTMGATKLERRGERIDRYKLLQPIGEGGFGTVWMAEQSEPVKRRVALKIVKLGMDTKQVIARFEAERQALAMMDHPNIAKVIDAGATETGRPYFVMELVKGVPITEYCDMGTLTTDERLELFISVCKAAQHAHQKGIIHRDIKPSNVLITLQDGKPVVKVIDFGIAKAIDQELTDKTLFTELRQFIGTPLYMSPEQAEMTGLDIDTRSDIYSLGVLLYELLTGVTPLDPAKLRSAALGEIQRFIREEDPPKPSTRLSQASVRVPSAGEPEEDEKSSIQYITRQRRTDPRSLTRKLRGDLDWIVMKALEKDRARRYETANAFAMDIERYLHDEPVTARPPSAKYRLTKLVKRNKGVFIAAAIVFLALSAGVVGTTIGMVRAMDAERRADHELARATEVKRLITEMLRSVNPAKARGADNTLLKGILDDASARLGSGEITDELIAAELHALVGSVYERLGLYREAERHLPIARDIRTRILGAEDPLTLRSVWSLGSLYMWQGRYGEAAELERHALEIQRRVLGEEHPDTLGAMHSLALTYTHQGRFAEAEPLLLELLELKRRVLGQEDGSTLSTMNNLGFLYEVQGRYNEAEPLYLVTLELRKRVLGEDHPHTLMSMNNLGFLYRLLGRYDEAEPLHRRALELRKRVLGDEHQETLGTITHLGLLYTAMGRREEAVAMFETSLPIKRRVLGAQHPRTLLAMEGLATAYLKLGRRSDAASLFRELLDTWLASANEPDADARTLYDTASSLLTHDLEELRDPGRALGLAQRACEKEEAAGGGNLSIYLDALARAQHMTGDTVAAVETQRRAISLMPAGEDSTGYADRLAEYEAALAEPATGGEDP